MPKPLKLKRSQAQEKRVAKQLGGRTQPQSGAGIFRKEDVKDQRFLVQCKGTTRLDAKQITIKVSDLDQVEFNAATDSRLPAMQIDIGNRHYWMLPDWVVAELGVTIDA